MSSFGVQPATLPNFEEDELLVQQCLLGEQSAWTTLVRKYANLIFSIPIRRGMDRDSAADICQSVFASLLSAMKTIREPRALAGWLIHTTAHACDKLQNEQRRSTAMRQALWIDGAGAVGPDNSLEQLESERVLQNAIAAQSLECQKLFSLLFLMEPPVSYKTAAQQLGLSQGSIGPTRMRCLEKLRRFLEERNFR